MLNNVKDFMKKIERMSNRAKSFIIILLLLFGVGSYSAAKNINSVSNKQLSNSANPIVSNSNDKSSPAYPNKSTGSAVAVNNASDNAEGNNSNVLNNDTSDVSNSKGSNNVGTTINSTNSNDAKVSAKSNTSTGTNTSSKSNTSTGTNTSSKSNTSTGANTSNSTPSSTPTTNAETITNATIKPKATPCQFNMPKSSLFDYDFISASYGDWSAHISRLSSLYNYKYSVNNGITEVQTNKQVLSYVKSKNFKTKILNYLSTKYNYDYSKYSTIRSSFNKYIQLAQKEYTGFTIENDNGIDSYMGKFYDNYFAQLNNYKVKTKAEIDTDYSLFYGYIGNTYVTRARIKIAYLPGTSQTFLDKYGLQINKWYYMDEEIELSNAYMCRSDISSPFVNKPVSRELRLTSLYIK